MGRRRRTGAAVRAPAERFLADAILVSGDYRQHGLPEGALLSERPVADTEVHVLLDELLLIEIDQRPALEAGPGERSSTRPFPLARGEVS